MVGLIVRSFRVGRDTPLHGQLPFWHIPTGDTGTPTLPAFLFGSANGYAFDTNGPVSKLWLKNSNEKH